MRGACGSARPVPGAVADGPRPRFGRRGDSPACAPWACCSCCTARGAGRAAGGRSRAGPGERCRCRCRWRRSCPSGTDRRRRCRRGRRGAPQPGRRNEGHGSHRPRRREFRRPVSGRGGGEGIAVACDEILSTKAATSLRRHGSVSQRHAACSSHASIRSRGSPHVSRSAASRLRIRLAPSRQLAAARSPMFSRPRDCW